MADAKREIKAVIAETVTEVAKDPGTPLSPRDAKPVADELNKQLGPWILNLTNNEPWYQSKIIWGLIIAGIGTIVRPVAGEIFTTEQAAQWAESLSTLGTFAALGFAFYARAMARKSIGGK